MMNQMNRRIFGRLPCKIDSKCVDMHAVGHNKRMTFCLTYRDELLGRDGRVEAFVFELLQDNLYTKQAQSE